MASPRQRRLQSDYEALKARFGSDGPVQLKATRGNPPERYEITYRVKGLEVRNDGTIVSRTVHTAEINLTTGYPRQAPQCKMLTPIFHPNFDPSAICIGDHWAASESLADLVSRIGEMITYQSYNTKSPLNGEAARWADENSRKLPVDRTDFFPAEGALAADPEQEEEPEPEPKQAEVQPPPRDRRQCANCLAGDADADLVEVKPGVYACDDCVEECPTCGKAMMVGSRMCQECIRGKAPDNSCFPSVQPVETIKPFSAARSRLKLEPLPEPAQPTGQSEPPTTKPRILFELAPSLHAVPPKPEPQQECQTEEPPKAAPVELRRSEPEPDPQPPSDVAMTPDAAPTAAAPETIQPQSVPESEQLLAVTATLQTIRPETEIEHQPEPPEPARPEPESPIISCARCGSPTSDNETFCPDCLKAHGKTKLNAEAVLHERIESLKQLLVRGNYGAARIEVDRFLTELPGEPDLLNMKATIEQELARATTQLNRANEAFAQGQYWTFLSLIRDLNGEVDAALESQKVAHSKVEEARNLLFGIDNLVRERPNAAVQYCQQALRCCTDFPPAIAAQEKAGRRLTQLAQECDELSARIRQLIGARSATVRDIEELQLLHRYLCASLAAQDKQSVLTKEVELVLRTWQQGLAHEARTRARLSTVHVTFRLLVAVALFVVAVLAVLTSVPGSALADLLEYSAGVDSRDFATKATLWTIAAASAGVGLWLLSSAMALKIRSNSAQQSELRNIDAGINQSGGHPASQVPGRRLLPAFLCVLLLSVGFAGYHIWATRPTSPSRSTENVWARFLLDARFVRFKDPRNPAEVAKIVQGCKDKDIYIGVHKDRSVTGICAPDRNYAIENVVAAFGPWDRQEDKSYWWGPLELCTDRTSGEVMCFTLSPSLLQGLPSDPNALMTMIQTAAAQPLTSGGK